MGRSGKATGERSKRKEILEAALTLFSERGYDGVGVDEIGEAVGVKGPTLYYYFKGKDAILDGLIDYLSEVYSDHFNKMEEMEPSSLDELIETSMRRLDFTIHDPQIIKLRKLLMMEQFRNERLREVTTLHHMTVLEEMYKNSFAFLLQNGKVKNYDPEMMAFEFTFPLSILVQLCDREPEKEPFAMERIKNHMQHFKTVYGVDQ